MRNKVANLKPDTMGVFADADGNEAAVISLIKRNYTIDQIAKTLGMSAAKVRGIAQRAEKRKSK